MDAILVVAFLVRCGQNLLICDDLYTEDLRFASMEHCRHELPLLIDEADTAASVVMGKCRYLLIEPDRPSTARVW